MIHSKYHHSSMRNLFGSSCPRAAAYGGSILLPARCGLKYSFPPFVRNSVYRTGNLLDGKNKVLRVSRICVVSDGGESYLDMWEKAVERERKSAEFERMADNSSEGNGVGKSEGTEELEKRNLEFMKLLEVSVEERDKVQRMQVIDRASAAIAAARALMKENVQLGQNVPGVEIASEDAEIQQDGSQNGSSSALRSIIVDVGTPGSSFWTWVPPDDDNSFIGTEMKPSAQAFQYPAQSVPVLEKEHSSGFFSIPFESSMSQPNYTPSLPPLQSSVEAEKPEVASHSEQQLILDVQFSAQADEAANALTDTNEASQGITSDGAKWWKETGVEQRHDGKVYKWTLCRGVSSDKAVEWENKYWEAADEFGYKELGSEKSGRDASGNVWREYWKESMSQKDGVVFMEKTAEKWGKNGQGTEWQEKWMEHYGAGKTEKWAHKWCSIDPNTPLDAGHAHVWHERWGETYDGLGGSMKYTDKWAERFEGDGWSRWGDKWDENFDPNSNGVKQGEKWWQGKDGDCWNRTWGERHNGSGWVHKYGQSSDGEHWDTHVQQDTWYERFPHYGFYHCFENSVQLRNVKKPSESESESES